MLGKSEDYLRQRFGATPEQQAEAVRARYGKDRTFAVPILTTCALAGLVKWHEVPSLPFELACFPQSLFRFLRLRVVSYALPALIAIGQCVYHHRRPRNPIARFVRWLARRKSLRVLETIQRKVDGQDITADVTPGADTKMLDLMQALKASLAGEKPKKEKGEAKRKAS